MPKAALIYKRNYAVLDLARVCVPERSVFGAAYLVIVHLAGKEKADIVKGIEPYLPYFRIACAKGDPYSHEYFPKIVNMAACAPKAVYEEAMFPV